MKNTIISFFLFILSVCVIGLSSISVLAEEDRITPYGDVCGDCGSYGTCKEMMTPDGAAHALTSHYREKGYSVGMIYHKGRFLETEIYRGHKQVDKVILDRKTGRIRSIY
jgi:hypothetical protein